MGRVKNKKITDIKAVSGGGVVVVGRRVVTRYKGICNDTTRTTCIKTDSSGFRLVKLCSNNCYKELRSNSCYKELIYLQLLERVNNSTS